MSTIEELAKKEEVAIEDKAAQIFAYALPQFKAMVDVSPKGTLKRVLTAFVEFPFQKGTPNLISKKEHHLFKMMAALFECNLVMSGKLSEMSVDKSKENENVETKME